MSIPDLIDKQDNNEIIAQQIAAIIKTESVSQVALAVIAGKPNPNEWALNVFLNRFLPWEKWLNIGDAGEEDPNPEIPIVNVWFDSDSTNSSAGNLARDQLINGVFNIDVYGVGQAKDIDGAGHTPADLEASNNALRGVRLVRNIIMSEKYTYLALARGIIGKRRVQSRTYFQPQIDSQNVQSAIGMRIALQVTFIENSPEAETEDLELIEITITPENEILPVVLEFDVT